MLSSTKILLFNICILFSNACSTNTGDTPAALPIHYSEEQGAIKNPCPPGSALTYADLDTISHLPDPFTFINGSPVTGTEEWRCRRIEIGSLTQQFGLGEKPGTPQSVSGSFVEDSLHVRIEDLGKTITFNSEIVLPGTGEPPYPAIISIGRSFLDNSQLDSLGVAIINFPNNAIAQQTDAGSRGNGLFYELYGSEHSAGALMAWAWGVSRVIDALEIAESPIDVNRIGVTGCSRNGKGALVAGAFDERISTTIPQESGAGGAASWRISEALLEDGQNVQTLRQIVNENVWFRESFVRFSESVEKLPFDQHSLMGMVAPRALLILEHSGIDWLGPKSTYISSLAAREIWSAMKVPHRMGFSQAGGHNHCQLPDSQNPYVAAYVNMFLIGNTGTDVGVQPVKTDLKEMINPESWIPWATPELK